MNQDDMIRPAGAARLAGVSEATVRRWVREQRLVKYEDGLGRLWISRSELVGLITPVPVPVTGTGA